MTKRHGRRKFSVIWNHSADQIEFYQNGIWNGQRYTQPVQIKSIKSGQMTGHMNLGDVYRAFRQFEKTGELPHFLPAH